MQRFIDEVVRPMLHPAALELVQQHQRAGDLMAIVTATNEFVTRPIAGLLGVDDADRRRTGARRGRPRHRRHPRRAVLPRGQDRARAGSGWPSAGRRCGDFERITFYSDSTNDLPLLERVSHPVATNPGPALERIARERGWPILKLFP